MRAGLPGEPFNVFGKSVYVEGVVGAGLIRIRVGEIVLADFAGPVRSAEQTRVGPLALQRRERTWTETIRVAHDRPVITGSWERAHDDGEPALVSFAVASAGVVVCTPVRLELSCGECGVLIVQADSPVAWHITEHDVAVEWTSATLCLTVAAAGIDGVLPSGVESALREPRIIERAASASLSRLAADGLVVESRDEVLDSALLWARAQLAFAPVTPKDQHDGAYCVLGALSGGDTAVARAWLAALLNSATESEPTIEGAAWCALAAARHLAWTGDVAAFAAAWPLVSTLVDRIASSDETQQAAIASAAVRAAALAAESVGERERVTSWRAARVTRLKVADEPILSGLEIQRLRELGAKPMMSASGAGLLISSVAIGLLGAEPDATRHRLRLGPHVPDELLPFRAVGLRMGEAAFRLDVAGHADLVQLEIEQTEGPVPVTLILEPWVSGRAVRAVRVDGEPAELEVRRFEDGWVIPVQITLDHIRRMEIERDG
jgi:hypothetical protein